MTPRRGVVLAELTSEEAAAAIAEYSAVVLPIGGGAKEHGPHLPSSTDLLVVEELARRVVEASPVILLPSLAYAYYPAFVDWPGSISIAAATFSAVVADIIRSLARHGIEKFLILDGGVSTHCPMKILASDMYQELGVHVAVTNILGLGIETDREVAEQSSGGHADELETSCVLAIRPDLARMERAVKDFQKIMPGMYSTDGIRKVHVGGKITTNSGINGDATLATADKGLKVLSAMANDILYFLENFIDWPGSQGDGNEFNQPE